MKTKINKILLFVSAIILLSFLFSTNAKADFLTDPIGSITPPTQGLGDPGTALTTVVNGIITVSQIAFVLMFLIGGVMYLTSMGNEEQAGKARKLLLAAIIGIVVVFAAWGVSTWIINSLKGSANNRSSGSSDIRIDRTKEFAPGSYTGSFDGLNALITAGANSGNGQEGDEEITFEGNDAGEIGAQVLETVQNEQLCLDINNALYQDALNFCQTNWANPPAGQYGNYTAGLNACLDTALENKRKLDNTCQNSNLSEI